VNYPLLRLLVGCLSPIAVALGSRWVGLSAISASPSRAMIPSGTTIRGAAATHEIKRERYGRKEQQEMNERTRGEMNRVVKQPKQ
jgi:hypothetical protein